MPVSTHQCLHHTHSSAPHCSDKLKDVEVISLLQSLHHCIKCDESTSTTHTSAEGGGKYINTLEASELTSGVYSPLLSTKSTQLMSWRCSTPCPHPSPVQLQITPLPSPAVHHNGCISALNLFPDLLDELDQRGRLKRDSMVWPSGVLELLYAER